MAAAKTNQGNVRQTKSRVEFFLRTVSTDKAAWDALFAPTYDLNAHQWRAGHEILDALTGLRVMVGTVQGALLWQGPSLVVKTASGGVTKDRLVEFSGADACVQCTADAQRYNGVALNTAANGERVYIQVIGRALIEASGTPPTAFTSYITDTDGKANQGTQGDPSQGLVTQEAITIDAADYVVAMLSGAISTAQQAANAEATVSAIGTIVFTTPTATAVGT